MTDSMDASEDQVVNAVKEYMQQMESGTAPSLEEFLNQHDEISDQLRPALEGLALIHGAADSEPSVAPQLQAEAPHAEFATKPIGDFQIVGEIGRGGMGVVYEAVQLSLNRRVALKVLPFASGLDEVRLQRFRNEAHAAAALHHTNIVPVYAVGSDRGVHYYAMQLIDGSTLADFLEAQSGQDSLKADAQKAAAFQSTMIGTDQQETGKGTPTAPSELPATRSLAPSSTLMEQSSAGRVLYYRSVVKMLHQATLAIQHAHMYGVIHRDIKPANLLLDSAGKIWVADFGLAQIQSEQAALTRTGDPMGTLRYMSPEQASGRREGIDHRTDIYSLGVTLYELLTLQPAIAEGDYRDMLNQVVLVEPPAPRTIAPTLPIELDTIVRKAIAKSPQERYSTAEALADDLQAWLDDKPIQARPPTIMERLGKWRRRNSRLVATVGVLSVLSTAVLMMTTLMIWKEQQATSTALANETTQRQIAERRFRQARSAVDTFSSLSESELSHRDGMQDLRRSFLETSLLFYQDFLDDETAGTELVSDLSLTRDRVSRMVRELELLDRLTQLDLLANPRVQRETGVETSAANSILDAVVKFYEARESLSSRYVGGLNEENQELTSLLETFEENVSQKLTDQQKLRLKQLNRQRRLPFTFKSSEVIAALQLTGKDVERIDEIIRLTAPRDPRGPRGGGPPGERPRNQSPRDKMREGKTFGNGPPNHFPTNQGHGQGPEPRGPEQPGRQQPDQRWDGPRRGPDGPDRRSPGQGPRSPFERAANDPQMMAAIQNTVRQILATLSEEQQQKWNELVGEPFTW